MVSNAVSPVLGIPFHPLSNPSRSMAHSSYRIRQPIHSVADFQSFEQMAMLRKSSESEVAHCPTGKKWILVEHCPIGRRHVAPPSPWPVRIGPMDQVRFVHSTPEALVDLARPSVHFAHSKSEALVDLERLEVHQWLGCPAAR